MIQLPDGKRRGRAVAGAVGLVTASGYVFISAGLPFGTRVSPGSAIFPISIGIVFAVVSLLTVAEAFVSEAIRGDVEWPTGASAVKSAATVITLAIYVGLIPYLGLLIASAIFIVAVIKILKPIPLIRALMLSGLITAGIYGLFYRVFALPLPIGPWGF